MTVGPRASSVSAGPPARTRRSVSKKPIGPSFRLGPGPGRRSPGRGGLRRPPGLRLGPAAEVLEHRPRDLGAQAVPRVVGGPAPVLVLVGQDADRDRPRGTLDDPRRGP